MSPITAGKERVRLQEPIIGMCMYFQRSVGMQEARRRKLGHDGRLKKHRAQQLLPEIVIFQECSLYVMHAFRCLYPARRNGSTAGHRCREEAYHRVIAPWGFVFPLLMLHFDGKDLRARDSPNRKFGDDVLRLSFHLWKEVITSDHLLFSQDVCMSLAYSYNISEQRTLVSKLKQLFFCVLGTNLLFVHLVSVLVDPLERHLKNHGCAYRCKYHTSAHSVP